MMPRAEDSALAVAGPCHAVFVPQASVLRFARRKPLGALSSAGIALIVLAAVFAPLIAPYDPTTTYPRDKLEGPSRAHLMGTDDLGRDVFSRIVYGARTSLVAGVAATIFGTLLGMVSGYAGGRVDMVVQRIMDSLQALPALVPSLWNIIWALALFTLPGASRIVRGAVLSVKTEPYIESARLIGAGPLRTLLSHILPNVMAPIIVIASVTIGAAILAEASLSFLGLGVPPPAPSWGGVLATSGRRYFERAPTLAIFPGAAITLTVLAFNLLGDTLRDVLDPHLRGR